MQSFAKDVLYFTEMVSISRYGLYALLQTKLSDFPGVNPSRIVHCQFLATHLAYNEWSGSLLYLNCTDKIKVYKRYNLQTRVVKTYMVLDT